MDQSELDGLCTLYEDGFREIQSILEDDDLTPREQLDAIEEVVFDDDEDADDRADG